MDQDEYLARIADRNPGFAGFYVRHDTLVLRIKAAAVTDSAATRLEMSLRQDPDVGRFRNIGRFLTDLPLSVEASPFDARELLRFKRAARAQVFHDGAHWLDLDESAGVIRIGVETPDAVDRVRQRVQAADIPDIAVVIEVRPRLQPQADIDDRFRPVPGAVRVQAAGIGGCTLTANALMSDSEEWVFLTAAHCTSEYGAASGEAMYQNTVQAGNVIGWEFLDPALYHYPTYGCPDTVIGCRYTDAALVGYESSSLPAAGLLARTASSSGSKTVDANHPRFLVSGVSPAFPYEGMDVHKIGLGAGWTAGDVVDTCVDDLLTDDIMRLCATIAEYGNYFGDSGAPVFTWDGSSSYVELVGVHFGGDNSTTASGRQS